MFYIFSKIIGALFKPVGLLILSILYITLTKNHTKIKRTGIIVVLILYLFSCPVFVNLLIKSWETPVKDIGALKKYDVGIVLTGGIINENKSRANAIFLGDQGDRIWQTLCLYRNKKVSKIIISGGDISIYPDKKIIYENDKAKEFLLQNGVLIEDIYQEKKSINTYENALFTTKLLKTKFNKPTIILISSAFHLKRAEGCFKKQGLNTAIFGTTYLGYGDSSNFLDFLPSIVALKNSEYIFKEVIGILAYWFFGYV
jgi:uncharacterized SAM-binding protein YcdF (DUF218 family)